MDPPLSETGREQARELKPLVDTIDVPAERIVASDLSRARETAELLGLHPGRLDRRWREIDIGEWGGKLAQEIDSESDELTNWRGGPRTAPDGETWDAFAARVSGAVDELVQAGGTWVVVCHGGCIRVATAHLTGADALALGSPPNASLTTFELRATDRPRLLTYGTLPNGGGSTGIY